MKKTLIILAISILSTMVNPTIAAEYFNIYVYDNNGNLAANAYTEVWDGNIRIADGNSDQDGRFGVWLDPNIKYRITARKNNQFGEKVVYPTQTTKIEIWMKINT